MNRCIGASNALFQDLGPTDLSVLEFCQRLIGIFQRKLLKLRLYGNFCGQLELLSCSAWAMSSTCV